MQESLSAADGDATLCAPIGAVALGLVEQVDGSAFLSLSCCPRVGIMTELAPHRAALQEDEKADAWPVDRTKTFDAMDEAFHLV